MVSQTEFDDLKSLVTKLVKQKEDDDETIRKLAHKLLEQDPPAEREKNPSQIPQE